MTLCVVKSATFTLIIEHQWVYPQRTLIPVWVSELTLTVVVVNSLAQVGLVFSGEPLGAVRHSCCHAVI